MERNMWTPAAAGSLELSEVSDGLVVYNSADRTVHYLNAGSAAVFVLCDGNTTVAQIESRYRTLFDLGHDCLAEIDRCLSDLTAKGVIT